MLRQRQRNIRAHAATPRCERAVLRDSAASAFADITLVWRPACPPYAMMPRMLRYAMLAEIMLLSPRRRYYALIAR